MRSFGHLQCSHGILLTEPCDKCEVELEQDVNNEEIFLEVLRDEVIPLIQRFAWDYPPDSPQRRVIERRVQKYRDEQKQVEEDLYTLLA
jgi:hypothetical protein